eukprot:s611_g21.t1
MSVLQSQADHLKSQLTEKQAEIVSQRTCIDNLARMKLGKEREVESLQTRVNDLDIRIIDLQDSVEAKDNQLASSQIQIHDLEKSLVRKENEIAYLLPLQSRVDRLQWKIVEQDTEFRMRLMRKENETAFLLPLQSRVDLLEWKLTEKKMETDSLKQDVCMSLIQKENANASMAPLQSCVDRLESKLVVKQSRLDSLQARIEDLEKQLAQKENETASLARRLQQPQMDEETWQYQGDRGKWISFPDSASKDLMVKLRESDDAFQIVLGERTHDIGFNKSSQVKPGTKKEFKIRFGLPSLPLHWEMPRHHQTLSSNLPVLQKVTSKGTWQRLREVLNGSLARHDGTCCKCVHGSSTFVIKEAYQVRNVHLWRRYQRFVRSLGDKHQQHGVVPEHIRDPLSKALTDFATDIDVDILGNERLLLHGTPDFEGAKAIATEGFDNRVARSGLFGQGTYFASQTCKAAQYATVHGRLQKATTDLMGTMLLARVAIGDPFYTADGCGNLSRPPEKNGVRADSIIARPGTSHGPSDGRQNHLEVVTFDPAQAYPEFIVGFVEK